MSNHKQERRNLERWQTDQTLCVYDQTDEKFLGCLADINARGMMMISTSELSEGVIYKLSIPLRKEICEVSELQIEARCEWSRMDDHCSLCGNGFSLVQPSQYVIDIITSILKDPDFRRSKGEPSVIEIIE